MSALRNDMHQSLGSRVATGGTTAVVAMPASRTRGAALAKAEVVWRVRAGSLRAELREGLAGVHAEHEVEVVWGGFAGNSLRCWVRANGQEIELGTAEADVQRCEATGLWHVQTRGGSELSLVATLRERGVEGWETLYAQSNVMEACGLSGGRYEVGRA